MIALAAFLLGVGMPETYPREILRMRARRGRYTINLAKAESGITLAEMARITIFTPLAMAVSDPVVIIVTLYLALNFAVLFQWVSRAISTRWRYADRTDLDPQSSSQSPLFWQ